MICPLICPPQKYLVVTSQPNFFDKLTRSGAHFRVLDRTTTSGWRSFATCVPPLAICKKTVNSVVLQVKKLVPVPVGPPLPFCVSTCTTINCRETPTRNAGQTEELKDAMQDETEARLVSKFVELDWPRTVWTIHTRRARSRTNIERNGAALLFRGRA